MSHGTSTEVNEITRLNTEEEREAHLKECRERRRQKEIERKRNRTREEEEYDEYLEWYDKEESREQMYRIIDSMSRPKK